MSEEPRPASSELTAAQLEKRYKARTVVHDVSLTVASGEVVGLLDRTARARRRAST
jgi:lipopolysaccharide export system ATP-binding protein